MEGIFFRSNGMKKKHLFKIQLKLGIVAYLAEISEFKTKFIIF